MAGTADKEFLISVRADIKQALTELKKLPDEIGGISKTSASSARNLNQMGRGVQFLTRAAGAYLSLRTVTQLVKQADAFNVLTTRIATATKNTGDFVEVQRELFDITQKNGQAFDITVSLFQSLARSAPELKATNKEVLTLVNTVQQLGVISGASQNAQRAGLLQFSQGLASGVFRAEEFNSLLENIPEVANRIAKGLGVSVGQLRAMVLDGKLLSRDVFDALVKQAGEINDEFESIPDSVGRASQAFANSFAKLLSQLDKTTGATGFIAKEIRSIARDMDTISAALNETELETLQRRRARAGLRLSQLDQAGVNRQSPESQRLLRLIDELDTKIIALNKARIASDQSKDTPASAVADAPEKVNENQKAIDKLINSLQTQRDELGLNAEALVAYRLQKLGATQDEIRAAQALAATITAQKEHDAALEEGRRIYEQTRTPVEALAREIERLNKLYKAGAFGAVGTSEAMETLSRAVEKAKDDFEKLNDDGSKQMDRLIAATRGWGDQFTNTLADMVQKGKLEFSSLADSIISDLLRITILQGITEPLFKQLKLPGFAEVKHSGGIVGSGGGTTRAVNPALFAGAPRYHSGGIAGLRPGEVPAILQSGELVISKDQLRNRAGGGTTRVEIVNRGAPARVSDAGSRFDADGMVVRIVLDDIQKGGPIRGAVKALAKE